MYPGTLDVIVLVRKSGMVVDNRGSLYTLRALDIRLPVAQEEDVGNSISQWPECLDCREGVLLPLSDFGGQGAAIHYKAWVCSSPDCDYNLKIRNGDVFRNEPILNGASHQPRYR